MKINLKESLNKIDLATNNKYDLLNTFDSKKLSDENKKKLAEAIENNSMDSVNRILHESEEQLFKVVIESGAVKRNFESALYEDEAEEIVDYYGGSWIDENGFEWDMYVEEDDDSTEHAMVDDSYDMEDDDERSQREMAAYAQLDEDVGPNEWEKTDFLDNDGKKVYINIIKEAEDIDDLKDIVHDLYWHDKGLFAMLRNFPKDKSFKWIQNRMIEVIKSTMNESLTEASYGGAYDIEDDMFFTKEEIVEFVEEICTYLEDIFGYQYDINNVYMDGPRKLYINIYDNNYIEVESTFDIDMRKIRKPSDLFKVYGLTIENWFQKAFAREYRDAGLDESLNESNLSVTIGTMTLDHEIPNWTNYAESPKYDENVTALPSTSSVTIYPYNSKELGHSAYWGFKAIDADGNKDFARMNTYIYNLGKYLDGYKGMTLKLNSNWEWSDKYPYLIFKGKNMFEDLTEDTVKTKSGKWVNKGDTGKTHGEFKTKKEADAQRKAMYSRGFKSESLKEAIDDEIDLDYETDFDDDNVEEGNVFVEGGVEYTWIQREAGPLYLDFDKWAVWSAREYVDPRDFMIIHDDGKGYDFDGDAFKEKAMAAPITYFVVEEDTGFIDWGPEDNEIAAKDFLNGKKEDWENDMDESLNEDKELNEYYIVNLHYEDVGDGREYDYEADYDDVLEYLMEICVDDDSAPEDTQEYVDWVETNFDYLLKKYEYRVLNYFEEDASQEEYDRRHSSYEPEYDPMD